MKKKEMTVVFLIMAMLMGAGCAGVGHAPKQAAPLDNWLESEALPQITGQLMNNTFMKDLPFIIVKGKGEVVNQHIDGLTAEVRERIEDHLIGQYGIRLVLRNPAAPPDRPYKLQDLPCGKFKEYKMRIVIDIKPLEQDQARVSIRAVDMERGTYINGFSIHKNVWLSARQHSGLNSGQIPDQKLKGLKYFPFTTSEQDEMAAYLSRSLTCIFREGYAGEDIGVFVDPAKLGHRDGNIVRLIQKYLNFCNEIQLVNNRKQAKWILTPEAIRSGSGSGLKQFWIEIYRKNKGMIVKGLSTYAYYKSNTGSIGGKWLIRDPAGDQKEGMLEILKGADGHYFGNLYEKDGTLRKRGISIRINDKHVDWSYYDDRTRNTFDVRGVLETDGRIMVKVSAFPSNTQKQWELVPVD